MKILNAIFKTIGPQIEKKILPPLISKQYFIIWEHKKFDTSPLVGAELDIQVEFFRLEPSFDYSYLLEKVLG